MSPGDAIAFSFQTLHGARENTSERKRRAFSLGLVGDDARFMNRKEKTSPPFPDHAMISGQRLKEDWFTIIFSR